ncbi:alpha-L-fucosidase 2 [Arcicella aurantiaca]|uniref:Alpha-L-fucosidase 2 n=1 Tax=Arcicella aurantiaca TaxID=591202 RepID=A0A316E9Y2_9BACT|nr:glycoside hydrolase N-terminal domain-containing protein [Arcicella aurantiaca]PWK27578.1 alpha-L-fucosidase 2 [Arcicella aurantiaca]
MLTRFSSYFFSTFILCFFVFSINVKAQNYQLWYDKPAQKWTDALPIGNGRLGAMIFGGVQEDRIQFNEETLWTGEPRNYNRDDAAKYLPKIRQLLQEGNQKEAEALAEKHFLGLKSKEGDREKWLSEIQQLKNLGGNPVLENFDDSAWKTMQVPSYEGWEAVGFEGLDGAVWLRTTIDIPQEFVGKSVVLDLNRIRDQDFTYVNGQLVGTTNNFEPRKYTIPANVLKVGKNLIAILVLNFADKGGVSGYKDTSKPISAYILGDEQKKITLNGLWKYKIQDDEPPAVSKYQADYQPFGDLLLRFNKIKAFTDYKRSLNLEKAISETSFTSSGIHFKRTYLASQPEQVIAIHLSADKLKSIDFEAIMNSPHKHFIAKKINENTLSLSVKVRNGALYGEAFLQIQTKNGKVKVTNEKISVEGADEATLYLTAATNFVNYHDVSANPFAKCQATIVKLKGKNFPQVFKNHLAEYQSYYHKFAIQFGKSPNENLPTNLRLEKFGTESDPNLAALYVQYSRYLLISSSRPNTQPANLQGIWNDLLSPPWGSKYTTNINAQMNYWGAEVLNLSALHQPMINMIKELAKRGEETAQKYYHARGWLVHHNTDIWRGTAPINASNHGIWVTGGAWLSQHLWQHYLYTNDEQFLQKTGYPIMKSAALFFVDFLVKDPKTGYLVSSPSNSPEQGGLVIGPTMDHQIIRELFKSCINASELLGIDKELRDTLKQKYAQIAPNKIGKHGQLQEWMEDKDDPENKHRHVSHLWGVFPGNDINWADSTMMKAARQSLIYRGDEGTGWSLAWKINFWARFLEGEHALKMIKMLLRPASGAGGSYLNLFDAHPPFQIDGNFGGASGIAEMLIQSQGDKIEILPAIPADWKDGSVKGICARGGISLDFSWKNGKIIALEIQSETKTNCTIRYNNQIREVKNLKGKLTIL